MSQRGVTLIEVVIVATIVLALSSIAMASYQSYVKTAYQTEAKVNLSNVRQLQKLYEAEEFQFQANLEILGFQPQGVLRYNIGAFWPDTSAPLESQALYEPSSPICGLCDLDDNGEDDDIDTRDCCMDNNNKRIFSSVPNLECFGSINGFFWLCKLVKPKLYHRLDDSSETFPRKFRYFATGCVTSEIESVDEIDIWSINEHAILINHRDATQRNPTCH